MKKIIGLLLIAALMFTVESCSNATASSVKPSKTEVKTDAKSIQPTVITDIYTVEKTYTNVKDVVELPNSCVEFTVPAKTCLFGYKPEHKVKLCDKYAIETRTQ